MSIRSVNLNLLPLLRALFTHRSVTLAAQSLGISQSAASQGLARLREHMNDQLLVRIGGRMQLTPLARTLTVRVDRVGKALDDLLLPGDFDPAHAQRTFVIAANDYMVLLMGRAMLDLQRAAAPGIRLHFIDISSNLSERIMAHELDFALMPRFALRDLTDAQVRYQMLRTEAPGVLMGRTHPLAARSTVTASDLAPFECVQFHAEPLGHTPSPQWEPPDDMAPLWGVMSRVALRTSHFTLVPALIRGTDLLAIVPFGVGEALSKVWPTEVRRLSFGPSTIEHGLVWSSFFDADPAHAWFRRQIANHMAHPQASADRSTT